jgi:multiple sugar transport system permease protein
MLFVLPAVALLAMFLVAPVVLAFSLGFTNAKFASPNEPEFVGIENFTELLSLGQVSVDADPRDPNSAYDNLRDLTKPAADTPYAGMQILNESFSEDGATADFTLAGDALFWKSLKNTLIFALVIAPLQGGLALALALLINSKIKGKVFFRTIYFMPVVTSMVVVSILWIFFYQKDGLANVILANLIPGYEPIAFLTDPNLALPAIIFMSAWQGVGFHMIVWLAGLQTIPGELYEAATVDGANKWQQFKAVTWPGLRSTFVFVLIVISIQAMGLFTQVNVMTQGGPLDSTTTVVFHLFREGFRKNEIGYSSAIAIVFFILVVLISIIQRRLTRERD